MNLGSGPLLMRAFPRRFEPFKLHFPLPGLPKVRPKMWALGVGTFAQCINTSFGAEPVIGRSADGDNGYRGWKFNEIGRRHGLTRQIILAERFGFEDARPCDADGGGVKYRVLSRFIAVQGVANLNSTILVAEFHRYGLIIHPRCDRSMNRFKNPHVTIVLRGRSGRRMCHKTKLFAVSHSLQGHIPQGPFQRDCVQPSAFGTGQQQEPILIRQRKGRVEITCRQAPFFHQITLYFRFLNTAKKAIEKDQFGKPTMPILIINEPVGSQRIDAPWRLGSKRQQRSGQRGSFNSSINQLPVHKNPGIQPGCSVPVMHQLVVRTPDHWALGRVSQDGTKIIRCKGVFSADPKHHFSVIQWIQLKKIIFAVKENGRCSLRRKS